MRLVCGLCFGCFPVAWSLMVWDAGRLLFVLGLVSGGKSGPRWPGPVFVCLGVCGGLPGVPHVNFRLVVWLLGGSVGVAVGSWLWVVSDPVTCMVVRSSAHVGSPGLLVAGILLVWALIASLMFSCCVGGVWVGVGHPLVCDR